MSLQFKTVQFKDSSITTAKLADTSVDKDKINADVVGNGITGGAGTALSVDLDGTTLAVGVDGVKVNAGGIANAEISNTAAIAYSKLSLGGAILNADLAGSIADSKLLTIATADKVSGSAVQLGTNGGLEDATGLKINLDGATLTLGASGIKVSTGGIAANELASDAVTSAKINDQAVTSAKLGAIAGNGLSGGSGSALAVANDGSTITVGAGGVKVSDLGIAAAQLADNAVSTVKILDNNITSAKIAAEAITPSLMDLSSQTYDFSSATLRSATPTGASDVANKTYVDSLANGLHWKDSVVLATVNVLGLITYANGSSGVGATITADANGALSIDGVAVLLNERVLIKNESDGAISAFDTLVGGSGYTAGAYTDVPLTGGSGSGAKADITVTGNSVSAVTLTERGTGYVDNEVLSAADANLGGGGGSNFAITVNKVGDAAHNGIYYLSTLGNGSTPYVLTRATDADESSDFDGMAVFCKKGATNDNHGFVCTNDTLPTIGSTNISFTQFTGAGQLTAGTGITITGNQISVNFASFSSNSTGLIYNNAGEYRLAINAAGALDGDSAAMAVRVNDVDVEIDGSNKLGIKTNSLGLAKMSFRYGNDVTASSAGTTIMTLSNRIVHSPFRVAGNVKVYLNGQRLRHAAMSGLSGYNYNLYDDGATKIAIGTALEASDVVVIDYLY